MKYSNVKRETTLAGAIRSVWPKFDEEALREYAKALRDVLSRAGETRYVKELSELVDPLVDDDRPAVDARLTELLEEIQRHNAPDLLGLKAAFSGWDPEPEPPTAEDAEDIIMQSAGIFSVLELQHFEDGTIDADRHPAFSTSPDPVTVQIKQGTSKADAIVALTRIVAVLALHWDDAVSQRRTSFSIETEGTPAPLEQPADEP